MRELLTVISIIGPFIYWNLSRIALANLKKSGASLPPELRTVDLALIYLYTHQKLKTYHYRSINSVLRGAAHPKSKELLILSGLLTQALTKMPAHVGTCVRFVDLSTAQLAEYIPGGTVTFDAFTSSSSDLGLYWDLNVRYTITSKSGRDISSISRFPDEAEVLFPPKATFKVLRITKNLGKSHIVLVEV